MATKYGMGLLSAEESPFSPQNTAPFKSKLLDASVAPDAPSYYAPDLNTELPDYRAMPEAHGQVYSYTPDQASEDAFRLAYTSSAAGGDSPFPSLGNMDARVRPNTAQHQMPFPAYTPMLETPNTPPTTGLEDRLATRLVGPSSQAIEAPNRLAELNAASADRSPKPIGWASIDGKPIHVATYLADNEPAKDIKEFLANPKRPYAPKNVAEAQIVGQTRIDLGLAKARAEKLFTKENEALRQMAKEQAAKPQSVNYDIKASKLFASTQEQNPAMAASLANNLGEKFKEAVRVDKVETDKKTIELQANDPKFSASHKAMLEKGHARDVQDEAESKRRGQSPDTQRTKRLKEYDQIQKWNEDVAANEAKKQDLGGEFSKGKDYNVWMGAYKEAADITEKANAVKNVSYRNTQEALRGHASTAGGAITRAMTSGKLIPAKALMDVARSGLLTNSADIISRQDTLVEGLKDEQMTATWKELKPLLLGMGTTTGNPEEDAMRGMGPDSTNVYVTTGPAQSALNTSATMDILDAKLKEANVSEADKTAAKALFKIQKGSKLVAAMEQREEAINASVKEVYAQMAPVFVADMQNTNSELFTQVMHDTDKEGGQAGEGIVGAVQAAIAEKTGLSIAAVKAVANLQNTDFYNMVSPLMQRSSNMRRDSEYKRISAEIDERRAAGASENNIKITDSTGKTAFFSFSDGKKEYTKEQLFGKTPSAGTMANLTEQLQSMYRDYPETLKSWDVKFANYNGTPRIIAPRATLRKIEMFNLVNVRSLGKDDAASARAAGGMLSTSNPEQEGRERPDLIEEAGGQDKFNEIVGGKTGLPNLALLPKGVEENAPADIRDGMRSNNPSIRAASVLAALEYKFKVESDQLVEVHGKLEAKMQKLVSAMGFSSEYSRGFAKFIDNADYLATPEEREVQVWKVLLAYQDDLTQHIEKSGDKTGTLTRNFKGKQSPAEIIQEMSSDYENAKSLRDDLKKVEKNSTQKGSPNAEEAMRLDKRALLYYQLIKALHNTAYPYVPGQKGGKVTPLGVPIPGTDSSTDFSKT